MKISALRKFQAEFEKLRSDVDSRSKDLFKLVKTFKVYYIQLKNIVLSLDQYVVGKGKPTFYNRIKTELNAWGNMHGNKAKIKSKNIGLVRRICRRN